MLALAALTSLSAVACGDDRSGGPTGRPVDVVLGAPAITLRQGTARVAVDTPTGTATGTITFPLAARMTARGTGTAPELSDPILAVDFVRGAVDVVPYGGGEVRGASTIRYSFDVDLDVAAAHATDEEHRAAITAVRAAIGRPTFYADVWVDSAGRIRRVQVPLDKRDKRPGYRQAVLEKLVTVDFYDYSKPAA